MKLGCAILLLLCPFFGQAQCKLLQYIPDTLHFQEVQVEYFQEDSLVSIRYRSNGVYRNFPKAYSIDCENAYLPAVPIPVWKNDHFIGFNSGCGSYCFSNFLAPLHAEDSFKEGGQILFDTINTIYFSIYHDTVRYEPYLEIKYCLTDKVQFFQLTDDDFQGAIPLEHLSYEEPHPNGFRYEKGELLLFFKTKGNVPLRIKRIKVEIILDEMR